jgi:hypothetical protein
MLILVGLAAAIAGIVYAVRAHKDSDRAAAQSTHPQIRVESIPPEEQSPPSTEPVAAAVDAAVVDAAVAEATPVAPQVDLAPAIVKDKESPKKKIDRKRQNRRDREPAVKQELTRDAVIAKYRAARTAYETYKAKNGGRHDQEWNDLASYVQYHPNELEELARRIESFRAKLRE